MDEPIIIIEAGPGVYRVRVEFDRGSQHASFALLQRALPAICDLDRALCEEHPARL